MKSTRHEKNMKILGIETSCDESAAALVEVTESGRKLLKESRFSVLASLISSQIKIHAQYGGVVPEVAARNHINNLLPVIKETFARAKLDPVKNKKDRPDILAVTRGPGLATSLQVGVWTAQALSLAWQVQLIGVNHMQGHLASNWLDLPAGITLQLPAICLTVSGGHTELVWITKLGVNKILGRTVDDAAGEAYDKVAKLLDLGYPGGPIIDKLAAQGNSTRFNLPRPMRNSPDLNFSFSGLKTAVLYLIRDAKIKPWSKATSAKDKETIYDLCASFQAAVSDVLVSKTLKAAAKRKPKTLLLSGGVAANSALRIKMQVAAEQNGYAFNLVHLRYTTDNAAMIAAAGYINRAKAKVAPIIHAQPNWELK